MKRQKNVPRAAWNDNDPAPQPGLRPRRPHRSPQHVLLLLCLPVLLPPSLPAPSSPSLQAECKRYMEGLNLEALAQVEHMQQRSCFACAQEAGIHYSSLAASLNCVSPLTFHTHN